MELELGLNDVERREADHGSNADGNEDDEQNEEQDTAEMAPDVDNLIVAHEETLDYSLCACEIDSIAPANELVVLLVGRCVLPRSDVGCIRVGRLACA